MAFRKLYPEIKPYATGYLEVDDIHTIYWEQCGNPDGVPVVVLHGGPGQGASHDMRRFFDPDFYRIVIFDQRGCGRSQPLGEVENNTPSHLVSDIEILRQTLKIGKWHVFGGSWGAVLALLYASEHPEACASLIVRSVSLFTPKDIDWFINGMRRVFPEVWDRFQKKRGEDLLKNYNVALASEDEEKRINAALQWVDYEGACATLYPQFRTITTKDQKNTAWVLARLEAHYYLHHVFTDESVILDKVENFRHVPGVIIHGRYDMITPLESAYKLHKKWPEADYIVVPDGGHSSLDPAIRDRLLMATDNARSIR
ncbi:MAG: prolyl aminopeptidase [Alphaproteobacteria bacterium]|nr:MAG: prolyl aminopeptidase [Alphaproteobacteria bacterium]